MAKHIFSTLTCDQEYTNSKHSEHGAVIQAPSVFIKGGAGMANDRLITPLGVHTEISDEDYELVSQNEVFKMHVDGGFIVVQNKATDTDKVSADMTRRDKSSPVVPQDFSEGDAPKSGSK